MKSKHAPFHCAPARNWLAAATLMILMSIGAMADAPPRPSSDPARIRYDSHCLFIDGKPTFIYSGSFHYFRCPQALWPERFEKIKEAGFNTVETYVPWNWSERQMPANLNDYSQVNLTNLDDWLTMAEHCGFYVIVRPGPYICAEWDTGGYPRWLLTKKPRHPLRSEAWLRSDDPTFLAWCRHWYNAVCPVIAKHQITRKPPGQPGVILVQLENEYNYAHLPARVMLDQIKVLAKTAMANGINVPLFTCWTHPVRGATSALLRHVFDSCNFYPRWDVNSIAKSIQELRRQQPDAPLMTTELQGGWFSGVGGKLSQDQSGLTASQINNLTLFAIQNGDTIINYYMLVGGTNPGGWAARGITSTYDYDAPIREWGGVGARYQRVWALGHMLQKYGAELALADAVPCKVTVPQPDVSVAMRQAPDGGRFLFVRTSQHAESRSGTAQVQEMTGGNPELEFHYSLEPFGSKVLYLPPGATSAAQGQWLPEPAPSIQHPTDVPPSVPITTARCQSDPGPIHWKPMRPGESLAQLGVYDDRFVFYRANVACAVETNLMVTYATGDRVFATVNGKPMRRADGTDSSSIFALPAGSNDVQMLYENLGHVNIGVAMEDPSGVFTAQLVSNASAHGKLIEGWQMHEVNSTRRGPEVRPDYLDTDWTPVSVSQLEANNLPAGHTAVYRAVVELTDAKLKAGDWDLRFGRIDDLGWVYVNGKKVGETTDWAHPYVFDITRQLHPGRNVIAVIVHNNDGAGGLGMPSLSRASKSTQVPLEFGFPKGIADHWWMPAFEDANWNICKIGGESGATTNALLSWYRLRFEVQPSKPDVWVPWRLRLYATGDGFVYLNGHAIGRYWQVGPQHDFYLPGCWLHFGLDRTNVVTLSLCPEGQGASIQSAVVEPYAKFAEWRLHRL
jgi:Glycosyl hydrolases family 35/Beta-galactosidase, galactose-binding domain/Glycosyl hydrolases family 2, sugar binding domain